jgi:hypothetical protein
MGLDATVYGIDGRPLSHPSAPWSSPITIPAGTSFETTSAQRRDLIIVPTKPGLYPVIAEFRDWISGDVHDEGRGVVETYINVTA